MKTILGILKPIIGYLFLAVFLIVVYSDISDCAESYEYILDEDGKIIGAIYLISGKEITGQMAIAKENRRLLFVNCKEDKLYDNEQFMRRLNYNCQSEFAVWPKNIITYVSVDLGSSIVLTGSPKSCGVCTESPFQDFELPDNVHIDKEILRVPSGMPEIDPTQSPQDINVPEIPQDAGFPGGGMPGGGFGGGWLYR